MPTADEQRQIRQIGRELERAVERSVTRIAVNVHRELVEGTPVETGNLAANWIQSVGEPFNSGPRPLGHVGERTGAVAP